LIDQAKLIAIIAAAIRNTDSDYPAIEPGVARETVPWAKAVLDALDGAGLEIVPKKCEMMRPRIASDCATLP
jgi:hypothetical protein